MPKDAQTGFLPQRFQGRDAVESGHAELIQPGKLFMQAVVGPQFRETLFSVESNGRVEL